MEVVFLATMITERRAAVHAPTNATCVLMALLLQTTDSAVMRHACPVPTQKILNVPNVLKAGINGENFA